jgi:two-component system LytT family sensor kinase
MLSIFSDRLYTVVEGQRNLTKFNSMSDRRVYNWFIKYKLYHIPFWLAYHIVWWTVAIGSITTVFHNIFFSAYAIKFLFYVFFEAIGVYFNLYYLMPKFLGKGKYAQYVSLVILTILGTAICIVPGYDVSAWLSGNTTESLYGRPPGDFWFFFQVNTLPSAAAAMTLGMSVKLAKEWIQTKKRQQLLEKEKLETELKFLKSQFNPHFLFNSINSIFVLIHKNPAMASESLAKFSDLLRYQLYECNEAEIPLQQEITYIENFIELEKLRQENNVDLTVDIQKQHVDQLSIAPFILMPFIENAFKHVSKRKERTNWIIIKLYADQQQLHFTCSNSVSAQYNSSVEPMQYKGLGLKNVQRRLELLYGGRHELQIASTDESYSVSLAIQLGKEQSIKPQTLVLEEVNWQ